MKRSVLVLALLVLAPGAQARVQGGSPLALVTAGNRVVAVDLPSGRVVRRIAAPAGAAAVATMSDTSAVAGSRSVAVLLGLHVSHVFDGFTAPRAVAFAPDGEWLYVTDGGRLTVIELARSRVVARLRVGRGAGRIAVDPLGNRVWVALPHAIATLDVAEALHAHLTGRLPVAARDLAFAPDGQTVWAAEPGRVEELDAATGRVLRRVAADAEGIAVEPFSPARHVFLAGRDGRLRTVSIRTGEVVRSVRAASGPFALAVGAGLVATAGGGELTERTDEGRLLLRRRIDAARGVAITVVP